ncbi:MAG: glycosyltransferase [Bacteroidetes bacterium]|nr:glycosyltransferase [Bacteroidota bacterium]
MITGQDIVVVGLQPWDISIGSNCKNIATELAKHNRVLYINPSLDRSTFIKGRNDEKVQFRVDVMKGRKDGLVRISENLWCLYPKQMIESINWIQFKGIHDILNKRNNRKVASDIRGAMNRIGMRRITLFNDQNMVRCFYMKEFLNPDVFIYYIRDNLSTIPYFQKHAMQMEEQLIRQADVVVTNSEFLANYARAFNPNAKMVGQGCDFSMYCEPVNIDTAVELKSIKGPIIGYTGFLTAVRLDIELLENLARRNQQWSIVLVGPEDDSFKNSELHQMPNVHFLGNKTPDSLPTYIKGFDVAINPQAMNEVTMGNYPRKIDEYLAVGKPVVATHTPFMDYFKEYTYLAKNLEDYEQKIAKAIAENDTEKEIARRNYALTHTWEENVKAISELIEPFLLTNVQKQS